MKYDIVFTKFQILFITILLFSINAFAQVGIGTTIPTAQLTVTEDAIFNESGGTYNFRVETDANENMFFIDGALNRFGFNTNLPEYTWHFKTTNSIKWLTFWENDFNGGALAQFYQSEANNGNRVVMGITNYFGSTYEAPGIFGLSLNTTNVGRGGVGVKGAANNERGNAIEGTLAYSGTYLGWAGYFNADVYCAGFFTTSDRRFKKNIEPISSALLYINQLTPVSYYYDTDKYPGIGFDENRKSYGFIAQDLEEIIPEMVKDKIIVLNSNQEVKPDVNAKRDTDVFKVVNYTLLIPILTQAIKEQQNIILEQNSKINSLEYRLLILENRLNNLIENEN